MIVDLDVRYLVDNSVHQRLHQPAFWRALKVRADAEAYSATMMCPPIALEYGYSARNPTTHALVAETALTFAECPVAPTSADALAIQHAVFARYHRGVGAVDALIAAYAIANDAIVLHYDRGFERIAECVPELRHEWIVPPGSADR